MEQKRKFSIETNKAKSNVFRDILKILIVKNILQKSKKLK